MLDRNGWRIEYFGASTPVDDLVHLAGTNRPDLVVLAVTTSERFDRVAETLTRLAHIAPVAGAGATTAIAVKGFVGARLLTDDPVTAAERVPSPRNHRAP